MVLPISAAVILAGCSNQDGSLGALGARLFKTGPTSNTAPLFTEPEGATDGTPPPVRAPETRATRGGLFGIGARREVPSVEVNKWLWAASLDILSFLPITSADPYSGVIITGYGTAPGASRSYRAVVTIQSPAMDATSLNVALFTTSGPAPDAVTAELTEAILTRARQLRLGEG